MRYLTFKELLTCRQVNKLWREEASKQLMQQDSVIVIVPDWPSIEQFARVATVQKKAYPTENIFTAIRLGTDVNLAEKRIQFALDKISFHMKHLELHLSTGPLEWRGILFDQFVNLKELHFHGSVPFQPIIVTPNPEAGSISPTPSTSSKQHSFHHGRTKELVNLAKVVFNIKNRKAEDIFVRRFLRDMFSLTPNLQSLEWIKEDRFANEFQKTMFDCLMIKTKIGSMGRLDTFRCPSLTCGARELKEIGDRAFPLKDLHIQISSDVSAQFLENFLEAHGATLEILKLDFSPGSPLNVMVSSPVSGLANLRELSLMEYRRSIGFVGFLPCLKKLSLTRTNIKRALLSIGWAFDYKEQKELSKSLTELYVYNDYLSREHGNCTREIVLKLAHCFPNLKAIRLEGLDDSSIRHLFKSFINLEELYAPAGTYSDEAFRSYTCKEQLINMGGNRSPSRSPNRYTLSAFDASHLKRILISKHYANIPAFGKIAIILFLSTCFLKI